jgi:hypothetical protein
MIHYFWARVKCWLMGHEYEIEDFATFQDGKFIPGYRLRCERCRGVKLP